MTEIVRNLRQEELQAMYQRHGLSYIGLFGSAARGEETSNSDIDLLIDFNEDETKSLFDLARLKIELQDMFGKNVDLAMRGNIKKHLEPYILRDLITIYEEN